MCTEIGFNSVSELDKYYGLSGFPPTSFSKSFYSAIFSKSENNLPFDRKVDWGKSKSETESKTQTVLRNTGIAPRGNVSGEVGVTISWGNDKETEISGYISGTASDDKGNKADVKAEINNEGTGTISISAKHND